MHLSSPTVLGPSTPISFRHPLQFKPLTSSPLAESLSSPVIAAQARRKSQYKSQCPSTPMSTRRHSDGGRIPYSSTFSLAPPENPPKLSMRERFRARCIERAVKERKNAIVGKRYMPTEPSSDDYPMNDDESEDEEDIMKDELFRRIMENTNRKQQHAYRVSYAVEVGSSFDPNIEDIDYWEQELTGSKSGASSSRGASIAAASHSKFSSPSSSHLQREEEIPLEYDDEELEAYAEEYARMTALADFEDLPEEELFNESDFEELLDSDNRRSHQDMDIS